MISCLIQNFHEEQIVSSLLLIACEKCYPLKIIESYNILGRKGPLGINLSNLSLKAQLTSKLAQDHV